MVKHSPQILASEEKATTNFDDVPLVEFMYRVFTRMPGAVTVGESGPCCCVPCLLSAISSFRLLIYHL